MPNADNPPSPADCAPVTPTADSVAAAIAGLPTIGAAVQAIRAAGWRSNLAGNRITVNDTVFARYIGELDGSDHADGRAEPADARWVVYGIGERPAVRIVATRNAELT